MKKPRIAIQNFHKLPNLVNYKIHNYVLELIREGHVDCLYFNERHFFKNIRGKLSLLNEIRKKYSLKGLGLGKVKIIFSERALNKHCDILLNFNSLLPEEFTPAIKRFKGIKIFHIMDYFWKEPGSEKCKRLKDYNVDYVMSYGRSDLHCPYFKSAFPDYVGKVIPIPFGYADRFACGTPFNQRLNKCVAIGSVNPLRPSDADPINYIESANFHKDETWFHKFRRMIVEQKDNLTDEIDSMLPVFPQYKDNKYDIVKKLNEYKMFTCDESIFYFPAAKTFEGPASGTVMVCSEHPCFKDYGFQHGVNAVMHKEFDIEDLRKHIHYYQNHSDELLNIHEQGKRFVETYYCHKAIAVNIRKIYEMLYNGRQPTIFWPEAQ